jgi:hypothetical protein
LLFNFTLQYIIRKVQEKQEGVELNGTRKVLFCVDDINVLGKNINAIKTYEAVLDTLFKEVGLEVNAVKIKYMFVSSPECRKKSECNDS